MNVLVVAPTRREAAGIGHGAVAADSLRPRGALDELLGKQAVDAMVIAGVCGGLDPSLAAGSLIVAKRVVAPGRPERLADARLVEAARRAMSADGLAFVSSTLLTIPTPASTRREKTDLWNAHGAAGADMETHALAEAADALGVPWLALRSVVDPAWRALIEPLGQWRHETDERALLRVLALRPWTWPDVVLLARDMRRALRSLRAGTEALLRALASYDAGARLVEHAATPAVRGLC